jgi:hypothetical protein
MTIDGTEPGRDHGSDMDEHGRGIVREQRLYQLIASPGKIPEFKFCAVRVTPVRETEAVE